MWNFKISLRSFSEIDLERFLSSETISTWNRYFPFISNANCKHQDNPHRFINYKSRYGFLIFSKKKLSVFFALTIYEFLILIFWTFFHLSLCIKIRVAISIIMRTHREEMCIICILTENCVLPKSLLIFFTLKL